MHPCRCHIWRRRWRSVSWRT